MVRMTQRHCLEGQVYSVPLIQPELRREEAVHQIADALLYLESISTDIFRRVSESVEKNRRQLQSVSDRIRLAQARVDKIKGSKKATKVFSSAKYPAPDRLQDYSSIFTGAADPSSQTRPRHKIQNKLRPFDETAWQEKLMYFPVCVSNKKKSEDETEEGLGSLPRNISSVSSLLLFNTTENLYKKYVFLDPLAGAVTKTHTTLETEKEEKPFDAPLSIAMREQLERQQRVFSTCQIWVTCLRSTCRPTSPTSQVLQTTCRTAQTSGLDSPHRDPRRTSLSCPPSPRRASHLEFSTKQILYHLHRLLPLPLPPSLSSLLPPLQELLHLLHHFPLQRSTQTSLKRQVQAPCPELRAKWCSPRTAAPTCWSPSVTPAASAKPSYATLRTARWRRRNRKSRSKRSELHPAVETSCRISSTNWPCAEKAYQEKARPVGSPATRLLVPAVRLPGCRMSSHHLQPLIWRQMMKTGRRDVIGDERHQ
ncbi:WASH complex subunit 1 isoform X1 [Austrofundulus limnaeus]|uniref:WASH complex subunit 1 isoform X1 n=1 Tax=Austrofundulus limnaeus TaxID=52670 RepID=A0A2I4ATZ8_AUSLI|nr:PREDICTED: uncharacterized protein LOC106514302 isoform X1 [Austrofundulus limnaeus]